jgi:hypothetical protein
MPQSFAGWAPVRPQDLPSWNERLLNTDAHLYQYPYWNEPLRHIHLRPQYLAYYSGGEVLAFVALLSVDVPLFRIAIVKGGPVSLAAGEGITDEILEGLYSWCRRERFVFLRISHPDSAIADRAASLAQSEREDRFPLYSPLEFDLLVEQQDDEAAMLASFQRLARRNVRDASALNYEIDVTDDPNALKESWPLFLALSEKKGVRVYNRPMESYFEMLSLAKPHRAARIYTARLNGVLVESIVIIRDGATAHYVAGALDTGALGEHRNASPTTLLHWKAMRDFYKLGVRNYSLGLTMYGFKEKFRPRQRDFPAPVSVILRPSLYRAWVALEPRIRRHGPTLRTLASRLLSR